jgi:hypothetical protein
MASDPYPVASDPRGELDLSQLSVHLPAIQAGREASASREAAIRRFCAAGRWRLCAIAEAAGVSHQYVSKLAKRTRAVEQFDPSVSNDRQATAQAPSVVEVSPETNARRTARIDWIQVCLDRLADGDSQPLNIITRAEAADILALAADRESTLQAAIVATLHQLAATTESAI